MRYQLLDRVEHRNGHGPGYVVGYNQDTEGLYHRYRYPYIIKFDTGYTDVYAEDDVEPMEDL